MEKVKERIIACLAVGVVYILIITSIWMVNHRVDYIEGLSQVDTNPIAISK